MKKLTRIIICLMLCVVSISMVACDNRSDKEKQYTYPTAFTDTKSNGGLAVRKGDYIYCVNGYVEGKSSEWPDSYQDTKFSHGGLMVVKLDDNGNLITDENKLIKDEYYVYMSDMLCGFNATSLYIDGNYLYFVAVSNGNEDKADDHVWARSRVCLYKVSLDKKETTLVYTSNKMTTGAKVEFYSSNGSVFAILVEDDKSFTRVNCNTANTADSAVAITSINFDAQNVVYYVAQNAQSKYEVWSLDVITGHKDLLATKSGETKIRFASKDFVYYENDGSLYSCDLKNDFTETEKYVYIGGFTDMVLLPNEQIMVLQNNMIRLIKDNYLLNNDDYITDDAGISEIVGISNGYLVYVDGGNKNVKMVDYNQVLNNLNNGKSDVVKGGDGDIIAEVNDASLAKFDLSEDDAYMYFFNKVNNHYYTQRTKIQNRQADDKVETVGIYLAEDIPAVEETEE